MFIAIAVVVIIMPWFKACNLPCLLNYLSLHIYGPSLSEHLLLPLHLDVYLACS